MGHKTKNIRKAKLSDFYCTSCSNKGVPIFRVSGQEREPGHLKKIFCIFCQREVNMVEIKFNGKYTLDDFWIEYNYHNFDENGNRIEPYKQFVSKVRQEMISNEK